MSASRTKKSPALDLDIDGFAERLGAGLERFASSDWPVLAEQPRRPGVDAETRQIMADVVSEITAISEYIMMMEAGILAAAAAGGLDPTVILACQELGRRRGRRRALAQIRSRGEDHAPTDS